MFTTKRLHFTGLALAVFLLGVSLSATSQPAESDDINELRKAADQGDAKAQFELGNMYFCGFT